MPPPSLVTVVVEATETRNVETDAAEGKTIESEPVPTIDPPVLPPMKVNVAPVCVEADEGRVTTAVELLNIPQLFN